MTQPSGFPSTSFWVARREAALNWLALGLLLAAWNATDNDAEVQVQRPAALRGYSSVSVRGAQRAIGTFARNSHKSVNLL